LDISRFLATEPPPDPTIFGLPWRLVMALVVGGVAVIIGVYVVLSDPSRRPPSHVPEPPLPEEGVQSDGAQAEE